MYDCYLCQMNALLACKLPDNAIKYNLLRSFRTIPVLDEFVCYDCCVLVNIRILQSTRQLLLVLQQHKEEGAKINSYNIYST